MRVLIVSDTHGRHTAFETALEQAGRIDYLVHLGDTEGGEDYIEALCGCPAYILAGNNDFFSSSLREMEIDFAGGLHFHQRIPRPVIHLLRIHIRLLRKLRLCPVNL